MHSRRRGDAVVVRCDDGDRVPEVILAAARAHGVTAGAVSAIGAFRRAELWFWNPQTRAYEPRTVEEQCEVISLSGNLGAAPDGAPALHLHASLGRSDFSCVAGHLAWGEVHPTLEVVLLPMAEALPRRLDPATGLKLLDLERA